MLNEAHRRIARREWYFPALLVVFFVVAGSIPYVYAYGHAKPGTRFMGFIGRGAAHSHGYNMFIRQAQEGYNLFDNKLTPEPLPRAYFHPEYWMVGQAARWSGLSLDAIFHVHRVLAVIFTIFATYFLAAQCLDDVFQRRLAASFIVFGAGFGWIVWAYTHMQLPSIPPGTLLPPPSIRDIEGVTVFGYLMNKPHFMITGACIAMAFGCAVAGERERRTRLFVWSGLFALANVMLRAYAIFEIALVYAVFPLLMNARDRRWDWPRFGRFMLAGSMLAPAAVFYAYLSLAHVLGDGGYELPPGRVLEYVLWYGIPFVAALLYIVGPGHFRMLPPGRLLLILWWLFGLVVAQAYPLVRAGEESAFYPFIWVPAILVAAEPLALKRFSRRVAVTIAIVLVAVSSLSNAIVYTRFFSWLDERAGNYYIDEGEYAAMKWLEQNTARSDLVFSGPQTCPLIAALAGNKTFTGHDYLTANRPEKDREAARFFASRNDDAFKRQLLAKYRVRYVLAGPLEQGQGGFTPSALPELKPVFSRAGSIVYRIE